MAGQALQFRFRGKVQHRAKPSWAGSTTSLGVFCLLILVWGKKKNFFFLYCSEEAYPGREKAWMRWKAPPWGLPRGIFLQGQPGQDSSEPGAHRGPCAPRTSLNLGSVAAGRAGAAASAPGVRLYMPRAWGWLQHSQQQLWHSGQVS